MSVGDEGGEKLAGQRGGTSDWERVSAAMHKMHIEEICM